MTKPMNVYRYDVQHRFSDKLVWISHKWTNNLIYLRKKGKGYEMKRPGSTTGKWFPVGSEVSYFFE